MFESPDDKESKYYAERNRRQRQCSCVQGFPELKPQRSKQHDDDELQEIRTVTFENTLMESLRCFLGLFAYLFWHDSSYCNLDRF